MPSEHAPSMPVVCLGCPSCFMALKQFPDQLRLLIRQQLLTFLHGASSTSYLPHHILDLEAEPIL
jgi:hypothetical protein